MNLREIDALVATKIIGFEKVLKGADWFIANKFGEPGEILPFYTSDISAAWEVVEKIGLLNFNSLEKYWVNGKWRIGSHNCGDEFEALVEGIESAPLAICLAALKSVGVEVNQ